MLSESNARILQALKNVGGIVFSDQWPTGFDRMRMDELVRLGYVNSSRHESGMAVYQLMPAGDDALSAYYDEARRRAAEKADRWWTRGLAIVAILISLIALILEFDSRGYLAFLKPGKTGA